MELFSVDAYFFTVSAQTLEANSAVCGSEQGIIRTPAHVGAGMDVCTSLTNQDVTGKNELTVAAFHAEPFGF
jgi:hypothetical protein